ADREAQQLFGDGSVKPTAAMGDGSVRKGITDGTSHASKDPGPPGRLPAVQSTNAHAGPGGGSGISGPMKTESANGNQSPGSPASTVTSASHAICPPNISTISGLPTVVFSPSELFNPYTIKGCGFGNGLGKVYLTGPFYGGK